MGTVDTLRTALAAYLQTETFVDFAAAGLAVGSTVLVLGYAWRTFRSYI